MINAQRELWMETRVPTISHIHIFVCEYSYIKKYVMCILLAPRVKSLYIYPVGLRFPGHKPTHLARAPLTKWIHSDHSLPLCLQYRRFREKTIAPVLLPSNRTVLSWRWRQRDG